MEGHLTMHALVMEPVVEATKDAVPVDQDFISAFGNFPEGLWLVHVIDDKYACHNATTPGPDPMTFNGLCCFMTRLDAEAWIKSFTATPGSAPKPEQSKFNDARSMAIKKGLDCLILWKDGIMAELHFVSGLN